MDHSILRIKLKSLEVKETSISWFISYLENCTQYTCVEGSLSGPQHMNNGVPQGSILGPLLFVCYVNDLQKFCHNLRPFLYADDTALLVKDKCFPSLRETLESDFGYLEQWFAANRLSLNKDKNKAMLFTGKRSPYRNFNLNVRGGDMMIEQVDSIKYLSVHIDRHLSFENHVSSIAKKVNQCTRIM